MFDSGHGRGRGYNSQYRGRGRGSYGKLSGTGNSRGRGTIMNGSTIRSAIQWARKGTATVTEFPTTIKTTYRDRSNSLLTPDFVNELSIL